MTFNHAKLRNPVSHENILIVFTGALDFFVKIVRSHMARL